MVDPICTKRGTFLGSHLILERQADGMNGVSFLIEWKESERDGGREKKISSSSFI